MGFFDSKYAQLVAYVLIVSIGVVGFTTLSNQSAQRVKDRNEQAVNNCRVAAESRDGLRDSFSATAKIGRDLIGPAPTDPPERVAAYKRAAAQLNAYESAQLKKYPKIKCTETGTAIKVP